MKTLTDEALDCPYCGAAGSVHRSLCEVCGADPAGNEVGATALPPVAPTRPPS